MASSNPKAMRKLILLFFGLTFPLNALATQMCVCTETIPLDLSITAVYPAPLDGESEWVEIQNNFSEEVDLSYYTLEDTTAKPQSLSGVLGTNESIQITNLSFQLNNGGDAVTLKTIDGEIADTLSYTNSESGVPVFKNASNNKEESEVVLTESQPTTPSSWPEFSEVLPNPEGADGTEEWIELYNPYDETLALTGLQIDDNEGGSKPYNLQGTMTAHSYLLISIEDSNITLNNTTDSVRLLGVSSEVLWEIPYENPKEAQSYALISGAYLWTSTPTPNKANIYTSDEDENQTEYENGDLSEEVEITEAYPNPEGPDADNEWIEITNGGDETVNLGNWTIDDGEGGSDPYVFPDDTVIQPGESIVIYREESGVALNNSDETVQLNDYTGETVDEIYYETSVEGQSYAQIEVEEMESVTASTSGLGTKTFITWLWSAPSPGEENPSLLQFKGKVLSFEENVLSLFDGTSTWEFATQPKQSNALTFQTGNSVLIQAMQIEDMFQIISSELLESALPEAKKSIPWGLIGSALLAASWLGFEIYKKRKSSFQNGY